MPFAAVRGAPTPLPWGQLVVLCVVIFTEPVSLLILYPFVYFMVEDFGIAHDGKEIGFYAGLLAASFAVAQFLTSLSWGYLSDRVGRKPIIIIGMLGNCVTSILFGMSKSYPYALAMRALCGFLNGNIAVAKSLLGELTDETNQSLAFSMFGFSFGLGSLIAPALGGLLASPAVKFPDTLGRILFLVEYPYLLPCLASGVISLFGCVLGLVYLREAAPNPPLALDGEPLLSSIETDISTPVLKVDPSLSPSSSDLALIDHEDAGAAFDIPAMQTSSQVASDALERASQQPKLATLDKWAVLRRASHPILAYMILAFTQIIFQEVFVFWCNTPREDGGLGWGTTAVGISLAISGVIILIAQPLFFPPVERLFGVWHIYWVSMLVQVPVFFPTGFLTSLLDYDSAVLWTMMTAHHFVRSVAQCFAFTSVMVMVNNSATRETLGIVNGIGQSAAALVRAIGPALGGSTWTWSLKLGSVFPLNYHLVFVLLALISALATIQARHIPKDIGSRDSKTSVPIHMEA